MIILAFLLLSLQSNNTPYLNLDIFSSITQFFQNLISSIFKHGSTASSTLTTIALQTTTTMATTSISASTTLTLTTTIQQANKNLSNSSAQYNNTFIVFNPVNLSQISWISKFRSCVGHNFSGYDLNGTLEPTSSMKHYFELQSLLQGQRLPVYAPFNGYVYSIQNSSPGSEIDLSANNINGWIIKFFHFDPVLSLKNGSSVVAGQVIGYTDVPPGGDFDIGLAKLPSSLPGNFSNVYTACAKAGVSSSNCFSYCLSNPATCGSPGSVTNSYAVIASTFDSIFLHMSSPVYKQFAAVGLTTNAVIIPLAYRKASPCTCSYYQQTPQGPLCRFSGFPPNDTVTLLH